MKDPRNSKASVCEQKVGVAATVERRCPGGYGDQAVAGLYLSNKLWIIESWSRFML